MSKRASEAALKAYPDKEVNNVLLNYEEQRRLFQEGYEQAEKDALERAIAWLKEHANDYIVDLTPTYPDAPVNIIVGGRCWDDLKEYMDNE